MVGSDRRRSDAAAALTTSAPVARFLSPDEFDAYRDNALTKSFLEAVSGPLVRSSYRAECMLERNNAGL
jgi:lipoic acid synthetase